MIKEQEALILKIIKNNETLEQKILENEHLLTHYEQKIKKKQVNENHVFEKYQNRKIGLFVK
jgi:hypothetical protein